MAMSIATSAVVTGVRDAAARELEKVERLKQSQKHQRST